MVSKSTYCRSCGYDLQALSEPRCPECGQSFDLNDPRTFATTTGNYLFRRWAWRIACLVTILGLAYGGMLTWLWRGWKTEQIVITTIQQSGGQMTTAQCGPKWFIRFVPSKLDFLSVRLIGIYLEGANMSDSTLSELRGLKYLEELDLTGTLISDEGLKHLASIKSLKSLNLNSVGITDLGLAELAPLPHIEVLYLNSQEVTDDGLQYVGQMTKLKALGLSSCKVTDKGLMKLANLSALEEFYLTGTSITDAGMTGLARMSRMRILTLSGTKITDAGVVPIQFMKDLEELHLNSTNITDASLVRLANLKKLKHLMILHTPHVTRQGLLRFQLASPKVGVLADFH